MIEVKNVTKSFDDKTVLFDVSCTFYTGKTNLIIGQSGSGKTVLMKSLVGLLRPEKGEILFDGRNLLTMSSKEIKELRKEIGMLFQGSALFDSETVLGNVMFPLMMFTNMTPAEQRDRAMFCIERVNLAGAENKYPSEISGGMQKRAAIARAISLNPKYLFCDEPNSGLDPRTSILIDELLSDITHEYDITTVINTHDMNSVLGIGQNIVFINKGHREWVGNMKEIFATTSEALNDFVFATDLFQEVKEYILKNGFTAQGAARRHKDDHPDKP
ncbi:MAG: ATP-binding cassette domain-containing protein [Bacteroidales bacterium]|nr:ATP-binding cassette domain-containing protein [Bacteroidales bacterium]